MSGTSCSFGNEATHIVCHALEKDLNSRGWLQHGYLFLVRDVSEPGIELLVVNTDTIDVHDAFPLRLQVEWEDINEHSIKHKIVNELGLERGGKALANTFRTRSPELERGSPLSKQRNRWASAM